ncbi:MAG: ATP-binding cassette domain-containing protein [Proteobacteria bacterium]|nr:ATP-binding cassette domain-containing protein [Pseudomonadota bacterium]
MPPLFEVRGLRVAVVDDELTNKKRSLFRSSGASSGETTGPAADSGVVLTPEWNEVLSDVSFSVDAGEVFALIGESGAGMSLVLMGAFSLLSQGARVIGGETRFEGVTFYPGGPSTISGPGMTRKERKQARVAGTIVADYDNEDWAALIGTDIGFMFQNPLGTWTPGRDHHLHPEGDLLDASALTDADIAERLVEALGEIPEPEVRRRATAAQPVMSPRMARRAMLTAALTKVPRLLVADEPFNGLEPHVAAAMLDLIRDMQSKRDMAVILATRDLGTAGSIADRVGVVYGGSIVEQGPAAEIYHNPKHPYTSGLIGSIPGAGKGRLRIIPGEPRRLFDRERKGCVFVDRCSLASEICRSTPPPVRTIGLTSVACHHADPDGLPGLTP